jgi:beta-lactamase class A
MLQHRKVRAAFCVGMALGNLVTAVAAAQAQNAASSRAQAANAAALDSEIRRIAGTISGVVGVAAWRLDGSGTPVLVNAEEAFPMASTFKVAVAGAVLARIDRRELSLEQMIAIKPDQMIASEVLEDRFIHPGLSVSLYNLLELMLTQSDNTATDVLVTAAGGPRAVTAWVHGQGVQRLRVDAGTDGIVRRFYGLPSEGAFPDVLAAAVKKDPNLGERTYQPNPAFDDDPRDTTTPKAMGQLLDRIFHGKALSAESTSILTGIMERCRTGKSRLAGRMPPGTILADKTGTIGGSVNDVGVVTLPDNAGQVTMAVYIKKSDAKPEDRERVIAEIARSIRDYYLFGT